MRYGYYQEPVLDYTLRISLLYHASRDNGHKSKISDEDRLLPGNKIKAEFDSDGDVDWKFELETDCSTAKSKPLGIHV
jgi:hypothetical protein